MTLEELVGTNMTSDVKKMDSASEALEALVVAAQRQDCLTVGVYESAKLMNVDPDSVVLCVLATDEEDEGDVALQIHFTLLQAFCCDNDIDIVRVAGMRRLAQLLGEAPAVTAASAAPVTAVTTAPAAVTAAGVPAAGVPVDDNGNEPRDLHCILVTNTPCQTLSSDALRDVSSYCEESRGNNQWVPCLALHQR